MHKTAFVLLLILLSFPVAAQAVVYNVNHSFASITNTTATLTGALDVPIGNFVIQNAGASPFTSVNLSLTVNATSYNLVFVDTNTIHGIGQFLVNATPTTLTFSTANGNGQNPADLVFQDVAGENWNARYAIGSDADPRFELAETSAGHVLGTPTFPLLFGTAVPEPSTLLLLGIGAISLLGCRKAKPSGTMLNFLGQLMKLFCLTTICSIALAVNARASITVGCCKIAAAASNADSGAAGQSFTGITLPISTTVNAVDGDAYSTNTFELGVIGGQTILSLSMNHGRPGALLSSSSSEVVNLLFIPNSNEPYDLSGFYNVTDVGVSQSGAISMAAELYDVTANIYLFKNWQYSTNTTNEQFVLGGTGGDDDHYLVGSPTGNLIQGHTYWLQSSSYNQAYPDADSGATALGNITLKVGYIPEPSTLLLIGMAAISSLGYRKR